jgi:hypothetical protein
MAIQTLALLVLVFVPLAPDRSRLERVDIQQEQSLTCHQT